MQREIAAAQLGRMRGMTRYYHDRFFSDIRFTAIALISLLIVGWWEVPEAFALVPVVSLMGAVATAFDASYLIFARHYSARLERRLDPDRATLVAADLEAAYLFPLDRPKVVTIPLRGGFSWFGFVTLFYTLLGAGAAAVGLLLAIPVISDHGEVWTTAYVTGLGVLGGGTLLVGLWWFPGGAGERRLREVLDRTFGDG